MENNYRMLSLRIIDNCIVDKKIKLHRF